VRTSVSCASAALLLGAFVACDSLKVAPAGGSDVDASSDGAQPLGDASASDGGPTDATSSMTYDERARFLSALRYPGPTTAQGSTGMCTSRFFVWRDGDGTMHSWEASTHLQFDHTFKSSRTTFLPSDSYIAVDVPPNYQNVAVYPVHSPGALVDSLPYAASFAASNDGVIRADQSTDGGTQIRRWLFATKQTEDISQVLPTKEPIIAFANNQALLAGGVDVPYALHLVNVASKTSASVTFDDADTLRRALPSPSGLLVYYLRAGSVPALRLYRNDKDDAASRFELGDKLATIPPLFADAPDDEHVFIARVATYGNDVVVYGGSLGIFAYDLAKSSLVALQLSSDKQGFFADLMCVISDAGLLVYRMLGDPVGQIWTMKLPGLLP
jgi:hypothetical protein